MKEGKTPDLRKNLGMRIDDSRRGAVLPKLAGPACCRGTEM